MERGKLTEMLIYHLPSPESSPVPFYILPKVPVSRRKRQGMSPRVENLKKYEEKSSHDFFQFVFKVLRSIELGSYSPQLC